MTFTGKTLVVLNLLMSFIFMAFAVMVYGTRTDLRGQLEKKNQEIAKKGQEVSSGVTDKDAFASKLADADKKFKEDIAKRDQDFNRLDQIKAAL